MGLRGDVGPPAGSKLDGVEEGMTKDVPVPGRDAHLFGEGVSGVGGSALQRGLVMAEEIGLTLERGFAERDGFSTKSRFSRRLTGPTLASASGISLLAMPEPRCTKHELILVNAGDTDATCHRCGTHRHRYSLALDETTARPS